MLFANPRIVQVLPHTDLVRFCKRDISHPHFNLHHRRRPAADASGAFLLRETRADLYPSIRANPPEIMNVKQLLMVSAGGLGVNLWGMYATGHHHHGHSHNHDHDHDHGHGHSVGGGVVLSEIICSYRPI